MVSFRWMSRLFLSGRLSGFQIIWDGSGHPSKNGSTVNREERGETHTTEKRSDKNTYPVKQRGRNSWTRNSSHYNFLLLNNIIVLIRFFVVCLTPPLFHRLVHVSPLHHYYSYHYLLHYQQGHKLM